MLQSLVFSHSLLLLDKQVTGMPDLAALRAEIAEQANTAPAQVAAKPKKSKMRSVVDNVMHDNDRNKRAGMYCLERNYVS